LQLQRRPLGNRCNGGVTVIALTVAELTVTVLGPDTPFKDAVTDVFPRLTPVTSPKVPGVLLTVAMPLSPELQVTQP
jgi:hypothetical protein